VKVKQNTENKQEELEKIIEKPKEELKEETKDVSESSEDENVNPYQVRLEELLDDLKLDDNDEDPMIMKENENIVENFIKQIENVKISKE